MPKKKEHKQLWPKAMNSDREFLVKKSTPKKKKKKKH